MRPLLLSAIIVLSSLPGTATAVGLVGFDTARPVEPQHIEAGGGLVALDGSYGLFGYGRLGIVPQLDARLSVGPIILDEDLGFEVAIGSTYRLLPASEFVVDVAVGGEIAFVKTADVFVFGFDPTAHASRHFGLPGERELFVGLTLGLATAIVDPDGGDEDATGGFLGGLTVGVDIVEGLTFALDSRWRDGVWRLGALVTLDF